MTKDPTSELAPAAGAPHAAAGITDSRMVFGHPVGLFTLFFTELWERFSYYGMRAILILYMTAAAAEGGLGFGAGRAGAVYGLYTGMVYLLALPGGWVADKLWGQRKAVFVGGIIIALGHFSMAMPMFGLPELPLFYFGLLLIVIGTGLLKPNVSTMVGDLYPEGGARRDAAFSIFYMGINLGAFFGPLLCGWFGEEVNWHLGFSLAGIGMVLGLISYKLGDRHLGAAGYLSTGEEHAVLARRNRNFYATLGIVGAMFGVFVALAATGTVPVTMEGIAESLIAIILVLTGAYFLYLFVAGGLSTVEKKRLLVIVWIFLLAAIFWSGFEQAGSSLNLFAADATDRSLGGLEIPASVLQSINPIFIILLAPVFGYLWVWLARRKANPSIPVKFALGLLGLAAGFFVIAWGAANSTDPAGASMAWLVVTYFLHTCGELCLSPVGLSSITKLAPRGRVGQMMGIWFIAAALGNVFAGLVAGGVEETAYGPLFQQVAIYIGVAGLLALVLAPLVRRLAPDVE
ncbi:MAG TPA: peptide MFS transporter [Thermoanaerobaculia bacterium]|nr:peptide MFS transporter [Thermoanaerobaculia bacterium]